MGMKICPVCGKYMDGTNHAKCKIGICKFCDYNGIIDTGIPEGKFVSMRIKPNGEGQKFMQEIYQKYVIANGKFNPEIRKKVDEQLAKGYATNTNIRSNFITQIIRTKCYA